MAKSVLRKEIKDKKFIQGNQVNKIDADQLPQRWQLPM